MSIQNENFSSVGDALLRDYQIIGCKKRGIDPLIPIGRSTWWQGVADGKFPQPVRLGNSSTAFWKASDIKALIEGAEVRA